MKVLVRGGFVCKIARTDWVSDWRGKGPGQGSRLVWFEMVEGGIVQEKKKKQPDDAGRGRL